MTQYAVTVEYIGDIIVEADSPEEAEAQVEQQLPNLMPDTDFYFTSIQSVQEEDAA